MLRARSARVESLAGYSHRLHWKARMDMDPDVTESVGILVLEPWRREISADPCASVKSVAQTQ